MDEFRRKPVNRAVPPQAPNPNVGPSPRPVSSPAPTARSAPIMPPPVQQPAPQGAPEQVPSQPIDDTSGISARPPKKSKKKIILWSLIGLVAAVVLAIGGLFAWYQVQLSPVDSSDTALKVVSVESGSGPADIAELLESEGVIRSATAFMWYTRFEGVQNSLQAGAYRLSPSESTQEIVGHLVSGKVDMIDVTLYPGATLVDNSDKPDEKKYDVTTALKRAGYTDAQITAGLTASYPEYATTLFQTRPAGADLEGYVYGETYRVSSDATVEDILRTSFDHFWEIIQKNGLIAKYEAQGLTLYEGITLASIVQREASQSGDDMAQIAQVFYSRLELGMPLGSDVTYQYIADKTGVARDTNLDSPYNTRRYTGLPPGPISSPGEKALVAVANPAEGDYLYFLSGDDDVTYFAKTLQEHQQNVVNHCQQKCQIL